MSHREDIEWPCHAQAFGAPRSGTVEDVGIRLQTLYQDSEQYEGLL